MNQTVGQGMQNLRSLMPSDDKGRQACIEAAITSANNCFIAAKTKGRNTANIKCKIDNLKAQLDTILNAI